MRTVDLPVVMVVMMIVGMVLAPVVITVCRRRPELGRRDAGAHHPIGGDLTDVDSQATERGAPSTMSPEAPAKQSK
jgi:hypothetical protein